MSELGVDAVSELVPIAHLPIFYRPHCRDACPVMVTLTALFASPDGDTPVIGTSANHQRTLVHDYLVLPSHGTGVYPIS